MPKQDFYLTKFSKEISNITNGEYECIGCESRYNNKQKSYKIKHTICGYIYTTTRDRFINKGRRCPNCRTLKSYTTDDFKDIVYKKTSGEYTVLGEYISTHIKIKLRHNICGKTYMVKPNKFMMGRRCPNCFKQVKDTPESYKEKVKELTNDEFIVISDYKTRNDPVKFIHTKCNKNFENKPRNFKNGIYNPSCPFCKPVSYQENLITKTLEESGVNFKRQYRFNDCRDKRPLPFDFAIFRNDSIIALIEYDGKQHNMESNYNSCSKFWKNGGKEVIIKHDNIKTEYCLKNNIPLLRFNSKNINTLDNEIRNIKNNRNL